MSPEKNRLNQYHMKEVNDSESWDSLVEQSPQGTVFSLVPYLCSSGKDHKSFKIYKGNEIKAGLCINLSEDRSSCILDDLIIYNGPMFVNNKNQKETKARYERFYITEYIIQQLTRKYNKVELALSPFIEDIRPFLWHNYHLKKRNEKFKVDVRYTSFLDISELEYDNSDFEYEIFKKMETLRQRNLREAKKNKDVSVHEINEIQIFLNFYDELMFSQGHKVSPDRLNRMDKLITVLLNKKMATMTVTKNKKGDILYITIFCFDKKRAYYLFGAGNSDNNARYKGTIAFWETFKILAQKYHIKEVDLEGVNSPNRGWYKLSFGGDLKTYYHVRLNQS